MAKKSSSKPAPTVNPSDQEDFEVDSNSDFLTGPGILLVDGDPAAKPTAPLNRNLEYMPLINWGPHNNYPQDIILKANTSPELLALIGKMVNFIYGKGIYYEIYGSAPAPGSKRPAYVEGFDQEVEEWIQYNNPNGYLLEAVMDMVWFNHAFTELIKNKKGNKLVQIAHQDASFCRFSKQNTQGYCDTVYINANWPNATINDEWCTAVPTLDPKDFDKVTTMYNMGADKVMMAVNFPTPGSIVYQQANWHSLFWSKWFDVATLIPVLKHALMKFTMTVKYIIKVPQEFWEVMARDKGLVWKDLSYDQKKKMRQEVNKEMNKFLAGAENAGKSFVSTFGWDKMKSVEIPGIQVVPIQDAIKDGAWLEDSQEASSHFIRAMDLTPSIVGFFTGKGMGAGSGSDSRVQFNILNNALEPKRNKILEPLNLVAQYNGWTKRMPGFRFRIRDFVLDTLDFTGNTTNPNPTQPPPAPPDGNPNNNDNEQPD